MSPDEELTIAFDAALAAAPSPSSYDTAPAGCIRGGIDSIHDFAHPLGHYWVLEAPVSEGNSVSSLLQTGAHVGLPPPAVRRMADITCHCRLGVVVGCHSGRGPCGSVSGCGRVVLPPVSTVLLHGLTCQRELLRPP